MDLDHLKKLVDAAIEGSDDCAQDELEAYLREIEDKAPWGGRASFGDVFEHNVRMRSEIDAAVRERDEARSPEQLELATAARAWVAADRAADDAATAVARASQKLADAARAARLCPKDDDNARERVNANTLDRQRQYDNANAWHAVQCAAEQRADERMRLAAARLVALHPEPEKAS